MWCILLQMLSRVVASPIDKLITNAAEDSESNSFKILFSHYITFCWKWRGFGPQTLRLLGSTLTYFKISGSKRSAEGLWFGSKEHFLLLSSLFVSATSFDIVADPSTKTLRLELDILVDLNDYVETRREL